MVVLQGRYIIVHHCQAMTSLDEVVVIHAQVFKVMDQRCKVGGTDLDICHDLCHAPLVQQHMSHLHHSRHMDAAQHSAASGNSETYVDTDAAPELHNR